MPAPHLPSCPAAHGRRGVAWALAALSAGFCALPCAAQGEQAGCAGAASATSVQRVNAVRQRGARCGASGAFAPAGALAWNPQLEDMARQQATWLAGYGMLLHAGPNQETLTQRAQTAGYRYARVAENLALGQRALAAVLADWTASEGHCVNLFDAEVTEMALACVPTADGRPTWVLILGRPL
jgi:uncharacterized protein YkwD